VTVRVDVEEVYLGTDGLGLGARGTAAQIIPVERLLGIEVRARRSNT
jgi:hypothetical protein